MRAQRLLILDWGDTLMRVLPYPGPMAHWPEVEAMDYAPAVLALLRPDWMVVLASGAQDSGDEAIRAALDRVGLDKLVDQVFCRRGLGVAKGDPRFLGRILDEMDVDPEDCVMMGDSLEADVVPALEAGMFAVWLNTRDFDSREEPGLTTVHHWAEVPLALARLFNEV